MGTSDEIEVAMIAIDETIAGIIKAIRDRLLH